MTGEKSEVPSLSSVLHLRRAQAYVDILRVDHWFKNAFMLLGVALAIFWRPEVLGVGSLLDLLLAVVATCLVASSNYVLNEILDAPTDRLHPVKRSRPVARGDVVGWLGLLQWGIVGLIGIELAFQVNVPFGGAAFALWAMGCVYNIPPIRSKEIPYLDVISESINNPIRLMLGWFALVPDAWPPFSLAIAYWMVGAFFMAAKRFAELRAFGDEMALEAYRRSFRGYTESRLLASMVFYIVTGALMGGVFVVRYKLELVLGAPVFGGFFASYMALAMKEDSPVQHPEHLHKESPFFPMALITCAVFVLLMLLDLPFLYTWFGLERGGPGGLWGLGV